MKTRNIELPGDAAHRCVILGQDAAARELRQALEPTFTSIDVFVSVHEARYLPEAAAPVLLVVTDSIAGGLRPAQIETAKLKLRPRKTICLARKMDSRTEVGLRSAGLAFLGTYDTFFHQLDTILGRVGQRRAKEPAPSDGDRIRGNDDRSALAKNLQNRLHQSSRPIKRIKIRMCRRITIFLAAVSMRFIELAVGLAVSLLLTVPVYLALFVRYLFSGTPVFYSRTIVGQGKPVIIRGFNRSGPLRSLPFFFELITGRLALVGTAIADWDSRFISPEQGYIRQVKPGIFSLWQVRHASRIAHEGPEVVEWEYAFKKGVMYDLLLVLRGLPGLAYADGGSPPSPVFRLLDLDIANLSMMEAIQHIDQAAGSDTSHRVFFVNPDCLNKTAGDREYFHILQDAEYIFPDGIGLTIAGKILQTPLKENINGTDMLPFVCKMAASRGYSLFLLGGRQGVADRAARRLVEDYQVAVAGTAHGYFEDDEGVDAVIARINRSGADILLVGMGAPRQEKWISRYRHRLAPKVLMGVGGLFDFYSGNIRRAPVWMRETGLEWVYRIMQEPGRMWRRYVIGNPVFLYRVLRWRFFPVRWRLFSIHRHND